MNQTQPHQQPDIKIEVNNRSVSLNKREITGLEIKQAAISQGVPIQVDFLLFSVTGQKQRPVKDNETIHIEPHNKFRCVAPDDNS